MRRIALLVALMLAACIPAVASIAPAETVARQTPRLCADYAAGRVTVEVLGDSVAAGYEVVEAKRWANQLGRQLPGPNSAVWNGAVSGSLVGDYLPGGSLYFHTEFTRNAKPSLVISNFRINDQWMSIENEAKGFSPVTFKSRYRALLSEIRAASPTTTFMIAVSPWILDARIDQGKYKQWDYINALWELKVEFGAIWMDWMRFMPKAGEDNSAGLLQYDLGHPSAAGQSPLAAGPTEYLSGYCTRQE